jgi:xylan 1,4-beta-xylosidase
LILDGGFGLVNLQGIPKPAWHAFRLLHTLGDEVLVRHDDHGIVTRCSTTGLLSALIFHYPTEVKTSLPPAYKDRDAALATVNTGSPARKQLLLTDISPGTLFRLEKLAPRVKGDPVSLWRTWGCPSSLSRELTKELRLSAETLTARYIPTPESGQILIDEAMIPWSVTALTQVIS